MLTRIALGATVGVAGIVAGNFLSEVPIEQIVLTRRVGESES